MWLNHIVSLLLVAVFLLVDLVYGLDVIVGASGIRFNPADAKAKVGEPVNFTWTGFLPHDVVQSAGPDCVKMSGGFNSGFKLGTGTYTYTFTSPGVYYYYCALHCVIGMKGKITVEDPENT